MRFSEVQSPGLEALLLWSDGAGHGDRKNSSVLVLLFPSEVLSQSQHLSGPQTPQSVWSLSFLLALAWGPGAHPALLQAVGICPQLL